MTHRFPRVAAAALLFALACHDSTQPVVTPTAIATSAAPAGVVGLNATAGTFAVKVTDAASNPISGRLVNFAASGSGTVAPATDTTDVSGVARTVVTAGAVAGSLVVSATVSGTSLHADATVIVQKAATAAACVAPAVGSVTAYQNVLSLCLTADAAGADIALIAYNSDLTATNSLTVSANGVGTPPVANVLAPVGALAYRGALTEGRNLVPDLAFQARLRSQARRLADLVPAARQWQATMGAARSASTSLSPSGVSRSAIPSNPQVGDLLSINTDVNGNCTTKDYRTARVVAIGVHSVVMADTANPTGGFTAGDYQNFAARFDTLVFPLDSSNFGGPTDIDHNGKVGILFTRAVNEATPMNSSSYIAGFFADRDLFPKAVQGRLQACATSNEAEMFYVLAPDPTGVVNGNIRPTSLINSFTIGTLAHEFQHLINAGRRLYVNPGAAYPEVTWLNEGLSHEAEELLYYRVSGKQPRQNLTDAAIRPVGDTATYQAWKDHQAQNFGRYSSYLNDPANGSPLGADDADDQLSTRGATWSFLRYSADRLATSDGTVWFRLVNSTTTGLGTLRSAFGIDPAILLHDWAVSNYVDDSGANSDPIYQQPSWNFRDIYTKTYRNSPPFPLKVTALTSGASIVVNVKRGSAAYYRLSVPANGQAVVNLTTGGNQPPSALQFLVVRTR